jgi:multiple sugar transport system permease protein
MAANSYQPQLSYHQARQLRNFGLTALVTLFALLLLSVYLMPFANMTTVSLRDIQAISQLKEAPFLPEVPAFYNYEGEDHPIYQVTIGSEVKELALVKPGRQKSQFVDPENPEAGLIEWEGNWRQLVQVQKIEPRWENFEEAWNQVRFPLLFRNTLIIAIVGVVGTLISCICVAYAFARFPIPGKNILFVILISTIILPNQVTLIPTYIFFSEINWTGTWLPLMIPHFFANAYNVFLLRQYFLTLPRELEEAAMVDGAGPIRVLLRVIIPQSWPAIVAVAIFHFVFAWNDFFAPLIYLLGERDLQPISVGVQIFNARFGSRPDLIQATSLMALVLPIIIFFLAQRFFMRGVVITGVEK